MKWYYVFSILLLLVGTPLAVAGMVLWQKLQEKSAGGAAAGKPVYRKREAGTLRDFWQVRSVEPDGVIALSPGNRYRLVCRVATQDFYLLSEAEQNSVEDALAAALLGLSFPVQALVTAETLDTRSAVAALKENASVLPPEVAEHAQARAEYLEALMEDRAVAARSAYLVVPFDTARGVDYARAELYARLTSLADALHQAKVRLEPLDVNGICDLLAHILNRGRAWRPSVAGEKGIMASFHVAEREVAVGAF